MPHLAVTAIIVRYVNYKDNDRILTLFTKELGRVDARARGCRRPKSPLLACTQPFVYGEYQLYMGRSRASIDSCDLRETFYPLREDMKKLASSGAMLAFIQQVIQEGEPNEELFSLLYYCLSFLCYGELEALDGALLFTARFLKAMGLRPYVTECALCHKDLRRESAIRFSPEAGGAVCMDCAMTGPVLSPISGEALRRMLDMEDKDMGRVRLPEKVRRELLPALEQYCDFYLEKRNKPLEGLKKLL